MIGDLLDRGVNYFRDNSKGYDFYSGEDVVLVGEAHVYEHWDFEEDILREIEPDWIVNESFDDMSWEEIESEVYDSQFQSLGGLVDFVESELGESVPGYDSAVYELAKDLGVSRELIERKPVGYVEEVEIGLVGDESMALHDIIFQVEDYVEDQGYDVRFDQDNPNPVEEAFINFINAYNGQISPEAPYVQLPILYTVYKMREDGMDVKMKGGDVNKKESDLETLTSDEGMAERNQKLARTVESTEKPLVAIMGNDHLEDTEERLLNMSDLDASDIASVNLKEVLATELSTYQKAKHGKKIRQRLDGS